MSIDGYITGTEQKSPQLTPQEAHRTARLAAKRELPHLGDRRGALGPQSSSESARCKIVAWLRAEMAW
jgi:hypothetical protein